MFFLTDLPTKEMISRYCHQYQTASPDRIEQALLMMKRASQLMRKLDSFFAKHDISQLKFLILVVIDREFDRNHLFAHEIAHKLDVSKPVLSRAVNALFDKGLILIEKNEKDRRANEISLTAEGKEYLKAIFPDYFQLIHDYMGEN